MKSILVVVMLVLLSNHGGSQYGSIPKNVKNKVENKVNSKADQILSGKPGTVDGVLRIGGPSSGANEMMKQGGEMGKLLFYQLSEVPSLLIS